MKNSYHKIFTVHLFLLYCIIKITTNIFIMHSSTIKMFLQENDVLTKGETLYYDDPDGLIEEPLKLFPTSWGAKMSESGKENEIIACKQELPESIKNNILRDYGVIRGGLMLRKEKKRTVYKIKSSLYRLVSNTNS